MKIGLLKEIQEGENRVALDPETCGKLIKVGMEVVVERGAGAGAFFTDRAYEEAGAALADKAQAFLGEVDLLVKVRAPRFLEDHRFELDGLSQGAVLLGSLFPTRHPQEMSALAERGITAFSTDCIPRITRAQSMDTLSSQANLVGYKGVLLAAMELPRYFPMLMTAAGTLHQAKVFVIGAGVAGLQAIATARRLGASVSATDVRPEVQEQIESVGGKYIGLEGGGGSQAGGGYAAALSEEDQARQARMLAEHCAQVDVVLTTALIGGVTAPKLLDEGIVRSMKPGAVIVDLGADGGGNCTLSVLGGRVEIGGVKVLAPLNLPSTVPVHASQLFSRNLLHFILAIWNREAAQLNLDWKDELLQGCVITRGSQVVHGPTLKAIQG